MSNNPYDPPRPTFSDSSSSSAAQPLLIPAIGLLVVAAISLLLLLFATAFDIFLLASDLPEQMRDPGGVDKRSTIMFRLGWAIALIVSNAITVAGAVALLRLRNFSLAKTGTIISVIPCCGPCFVLGMPFGIWALMVMHKPDVRNQFQS